MGHLRVGRQTGRISLDTRGHGWLSLGTPTSPMAPVGKCLKGVLWIPWTLVSLPLTAVSAGTLGPSHPLCAAVVMPPEEYGYAEGYMVLCCWTSEVKGQSGVRGSVA